MRKSYLAAELARRGRLRERNKTPRVERGQADRGDGLGLLLAALVGGMESQPTANSPKSKRSEVARSRERSTSSPLNVSPNFARQASANNSRLTERVRETQVINTPLSNVSSENLTESPIELSNDASPGFDEVPIFRSDVAVEPKPDMADFARTAPGRVEKPSYAESGLEFLAGDAEQMIDEPYFQSESATNHGDGRTELLGEMQELVRAAEAQADEERERRDLAKSRARLACYR